MSEKVSKKIIEIINKKNIIGPQFTFLCIGTDRVTGDCLGPIVGSKIENYIKKNNIKNVDVIGSLENPLYNLNIEKFVVKEGRITILIDSAISSSYEIGKILIKEKGIKIREALKESKKIKSDISIEAVVCKNLQDRDLNFLMLQNVKLNTVIKLSDKLCNELFKVIENYS